MGDCDGIIESIVSFGKNKVINFDGGYFSFAHNNEIALVIEEPNDFFILNCGSRLFEEVKRKVKEGLSKKELIQFWVEKSEEYDISTWSNNFKDLKEWLVKQNE